MMPFPTDSGYPSLVTTQTKGRYRLSNMELDFVSLVPAGDDPLAQVVIAKAAPQEVSKRKNPGQNTPHEYTNSDPDKHGGTKCDSCGQAPNSPMHKAKRKRQRMHKSADGATGSPTLSPNDLTEENMGTTINKSDLAPEVVAYIDALEDEVADLTSEVEKHDTEAEAEKTAHEDALKAKDDEIAALTDQVSKMVPKDEESEDEITKSVLAKADPAVRSLIEKQAAELKAVQDIAKAERDARLDRDYLSKAETMPMLTTDRSSLAGLLRRAAEALTPEDNEQLNTVLKAANEQIAKGNLFKVAGVGGGETTISKSVAAKAAELRKNDPTLTAEQAEVRVYEENPDLFAQAMSGEDN